MMGLLSFIFGELPSTKCSIEWCQQQLDYSFQSMADHRLGHGFEPINWPLIIANQYRAIALTRPLTQVEQFTYDGALQALNNK